MIVIGGTGGARFDVSNDVPFVVAVDLEPGFDKRARLNKFDRIVLECSELGFFGPFPLLVLPALIFGGGGLGGGGFLFLRAGCGGAGACDT